MVQRKERIIIWLVLMLVLIVPVQAFSLGDLFGRSNDPSGQWSECIDTFSKEECSEYCSGNNKDTRCTYPSETKRTFAVQLYATDCTVNEKRPSNLIGGIAGNEFEFQYHINMNVDKDYSYSAVESCGSFPQYHTTSTYSVPSYLLNNVKLYNYWWVDKNGIPFIEKPSQRQLNAIYGKDNIVKVDEGKGEVPMIPTKYTILNVKYDCNYEGFGDTEYDGFINSDIPLNDKQIRDHYDFTETNFLTKEFNEKTYQNYIDEVLNDNCDTWSSYWSNFLTCYEKTSTESRFFNWLSGTGTEKIFDSKFDSIYTYSKRTYANLGIYCRYEDSEFTDGTQVTVKVDSTIGYSQEYLLLSGQEASSSDFSEDLGIDECGNNAIGCQAITLLTFNISGNGINRTLEFDNLDVIYLNQTNDELIDNLRSVISSPGVDMQRQDLIELEKEFLLDLEIEQNKAYRDKNQEDAVGMAKEFALYMISFNMLIVYLIEITLFIGVFTLIMNSFRHAKQSFKKVFNLGGKI